MTKEQMREIMIEQCRDLNWQALTDDQLNRILQIADAFQEQECEHGVIAISNGVATCEECGKRM